MKRCFSILICFGLSFVSYSQSYWQQEVHYQMDIDFNTKNHQFDGLQELTYINHSPDTLNKVFYHLYFNAFQPGSMMDVRSRTIVDPDRRVGDRISKLSQSEMGIQQVLSLKQNKSELDFNIEGTILNVNLNEPIFPGDTVQFDMEFKTQVPIQIRRSGRMNKEELTIPCLNGTQNYASMIKTVGTLILMWAESFMGFGVLLMCIFIWIPNYTIAATGILQNPDEIGHGYSDVILPPTNKLNWHFKAENVHDFVWAADPDYAHEIIINEDGPDFHLFYQKGEKTKHWEDLGEYMIKTFKYADEHFGKYPYPHYSIIQGGDGGMEYPMATLITGHRTLKSLVGVSVHEAMHSWYQGLLASNEALFAWMDEGFTCYASNRIEKELFPEDFPDPHAGSYKGIRIATSDYEEPLCTHADHFDTNWAYGTASYSKGVVILDQLSHIVGQKVIDKSLKRYFDEWAYKHPNASDFKRIVEKESGIELDWYFEYFVNTTKTIDYSIYEIIGDKKGTQILLKKGEMPMPIEFNIVLQNGTVSTYYIPTVLMRGEKEVELNTKILSDWAWTNPYYSIRLDQAPSAIKEIQLHTTEHIADIEPLNDKVKMPDNWDWNKYKLRLNLLEKKKKVQLKNLLKLKIELLLKEKATVGGF